MCARDRWEIYFTSGFHSFMLVSEELWNSQILGSIPGPEGNVSGGHRYCNSWGLPKPKLFYPQNPQPVLVPVPVSLYSSSQLLVPTVIFFHVPFCSTSWFLPFLTPVPSPHSAFSYHSFPFFGLHIPVPVPNAPLGLHPSSLFDSVSHLTMWPSHPSSSIFCAKWDSQRLIN